jgi:hypothetical protein
MIPCVTRAAIRLLSAALLLVLPVTKEGVTLAVVGNGNALVLVATLLNVLAKSVERTKFGGHVPRLGPRLSILDLRI